MKALTSEMRRALDAIELRGGIRRSELTPAEKRTATHLARRGLIAKHQGWYVTTVVGRQELRLKRAGQMASEVKMAETDFVDVKVIC